MKQVVVYGRDFFNFEYYDEQPTHLNPIQKLKEFLIESDYEGAKKRERKKFLKAEYPKKKPWEEKKYWR